MKVLEHFARICRWLLPRNPPTDLGDDDIFPFPDGYVPRDPDLNEKLRHIVARLEELNLLDEEAPPPVRYVAGLARRLDQDE